MKSIVIVSAIALTALATPALAQPAAALHVVFVLRSGLADFEMRRVAGTAAGDVERGHLRQRSRPERAVGRGEHRPAAEIAGGEVAVGDQLDAGMRGGRQHRHRGQCGRGGNRR